MENLVLLATEASHHKEGFGLNFDILETNLINLIIIIGVLVYFGKGLISNILSERRAGIEQAIKEAENRQKMAATALAEQQTKLTQAQAEAERIKAQAEARAKEVKAAILAKADQDVAQMRSNASQELDSEREKAIAQLRSLVASQALQRVQGQLTSVLNDSTQKKLVDQSIAQLGGK